MRHIYIRFSRLEDFSYKLLEDASEGSNMVIFSKKSSSHILLKSPKLRRRVSGRVYIIDEWGSMNKWFSRDATSVKPLWEIL